MLKKIPVILIFSIILKSTKSKHQDVQITHMKQVISLHIFVANQDVDSLLVKQEIG